MEEENRIAVAMSGGVDSSMAAKILKDRGFDLIGKYPAFPKTYYIMDDRRY